MVAGNLKELFKLNKNISLYGQEHYLISILAGNMAAGVYVAILKVHVTVLLSIYLSVI